jgi:hypothetical protein
MLYGMPVRSSREIDALKEFGLDFGEVVIPTSRYLLASSHPEEPQAPNPRAEHPVVSSRC